MFKYVYEIIQKFLPCQKFSRKMKTVGIPLHCITLDQPFAPWGLVVIHPINPKLNKGNSILS
jgi:hypothetical protein